MKSTLLLAAALPALLVACGGGTPAPAYPYNPNASTVPSGDSRVPYYGDWVWVVAFADNSNAAGVFSISVKGDDSATAFNLGGGLAAVCQPDGASCPVPTDLGAIGTGLTNGQPRLTVAEATSGGTIRWGGFDSDGLVGSDSKGRAQLSGLGVWNSATADVVGFAMVQVSASPSIKLQAQAASPSLNRLTPALSSAAQGTQKMNSLQLRALAVASALADQR